MLSMLFCVFLIAALINRFVLGGSLWWSLLIAALALALLLFHLMFAKKTRPVVTRSVSILGVALLLLISLWSGMKTIDSGYLAYDAAMVEIDHLLGLNEYYKAGELLDKLENEYGSNDRLQLYKAQAAIGKKDTSAVEACLAKIVNKQSDQYYNELGRLYLLKEQYDNVQNTFVQAAKAYPLWSEAQRIAGIQSVINKNYSIGEYFLLRAFEQVPSDPIPLYYLGVIRYEQGSFTKAEEYFSEALQLGLNNEYTSYVAWYRQEMGGGK